jgi:hypothetical protein
VQDEKKEKELNFSLKASLAAAEEKRIFEVGVQNPGSALRLTSFRGCQIRKVVDT